jgi:hypothetical protein
MDVRRVTLGWSGKLGALRLESLWKSWLLTLWLLPPLLLRLLLRGGVPRGGSA